MSVSVKDFVPAKSKGGMFKSSKVENFDNVIVQLNQWIQETHPSILSIETVVLPNIHDSEEEGSQDTELWVGGESSTQWYQIIRVWYKS